MDFDITNDITFGVTNSISLRPQKDYLLLEDGDGILFEDGSAIEQESGVYVPPDPWEDKAFYIDFPNSTDRVADQDMQTVLSAGRRNYNGDLFGENEPIFEADGALLTGGAFTQLVPYSEDTSNWTGSGPWTQSINLTSTGTYTVSTDLNGATITITAGTATIDASASATFGNPDQFVVTGIGTVTISTDTVDPKAQLTESTYKLPYALNATGGSLIIPHSYSDADEGMKWAFVDSPLLYTALYGTDGTDAQGQLDIIDWVPMFNPSDTGAAEKMNIVSCTNGHSGLPYFRNSGTTPYLSVYDGTNVISLQIDYQAGTSYNISLIWGDHPTEGLKKMQLIVTDGVTTWKSAVGDFVGSFNPGADFSVGWTNARFQKIDKIVAYPMPAVWLNN